MSQIDYFRSSMSALHATFDEALDGLTREEAHWRPYDLGNHIAFIAWHYGRTVDNIVRFVLERRPTAWMEGEVGREVRPRFKGPGHWNDS